MLYSKSFYEFIGATIENPEILYDVNLNPNSLVLDVGAFDGEWAEKIIRKYGSKVYAFEPDPENLVLLNERGAKFSELQIEPYGLGDKTDSFEMIQSGVGSSIYTVNKSDKDLPKTMVEVRSVKDVWESLGLSRVSLIKINIEGAEFPLLEKMIKEDLLSDIDNIMIQFHEWHPGSYSRRKKIIAELAKTHRVEWSYYFVWEKWVRK